MGNELKAPTAVQVAAGPGVNRVGFSPASGGEVTYEIWRRHGDTVDWYLHETVTSPDFEDNRVTPGQYYEYRVRTVSGNAASEFSESAVVYGK